MRMSCNGCRVLRKGCSEDCSIRPCLDWIKSSDAQAHATVFLAKFYGRAGLMNLIDTGPNHLRPAIFRSLLYEACGRMVDPIYGSVGLLGSGKWQLCHDAVEAVLKGSPVGRIELSETGQGPGPPLKAYYDIRHISKGERESTKTGSNHGPKRVRTRRRFKRRNRLVVDKESLSSLISHHLEPRNESLSSVANHDDPNKGLPTRPEDDGPIELDLTLGFDSAKRWLKPRAFKVEEECNGSCKMELGLIESLVSC